LITRRLYLYAKGFYHFVRHPTSRETFTALSEALVDFRANRDAVHHMMQDPRVAALCRERYVGRAHTVEELLLYPRGSLGFELGSAMRAQNYDPHFYRDFYGSETPSFASDEAYLRFRVRQMHDIVHVLTGFDMTEFPGELGMQAFNAAQTRRPFSIALVGLGMIRIILQPDELEATLQQVAKGFAMGFAAKSLLAERFEEGFAKPLERWRRELNLVDEVFLELRRGTEARA
jgi:ubiquinone biosynthesis protein Coq4